MNKWKHGHQTTKTTAQFAIRYFTVIAEAHTFEHFTDALHLVSTGHNETPNCDQVFSQEKTTNHSSPSSHADIQENKEKKKFRQETMKKNRKTALSRVSRETKALFCQQILQRRKVVCSAVCGKQI